MRLSEGDFNFIELFLFLILDGLSFLKILTYDGYS